MKCEWLLEDTKRSQVSDLLWLRIMAFVLAAILLSMSDSRDAPAEDQIVTAAQGVVGSVSLNDPDAFDLSPVQGSLDERTLLLRYLLGEKRSILWLVESNSVESYELPERTVIEEQASLFHALLRRSHQRGVRIQVELKAAALGQMVLGPVASQLGTKRLLVVTAGALENIPFSSLIVKDDSTEPLVVSNEIIQVSSTLLATILSQQVRENRPAATSKLAVLADPVFDIADPRVVPDQDSTVGSATEKINPRNVRYPDDKGDARFDRLKYAREEAESILSQLPRGQELEAFDFSASKDLVISGDLGAYQLIHVATHGYSSEYSSEPPELVFSLVDERGNRKDGYVSAQEVSALDLSAELVTLSACRTGLGSPRNSHVENTNWTNSFISAGAKRVVVSLWDVDDRATAELMKRFYKKMLKDSIPPPAALRAAQVSMLREKVWEAPYYWAGFIMQGDWR